MHASVSVSEPRFHTLEDVVRDELFPDVDLELRRGRHVDRDDVDRYSFLDEAQRHLEELYRRYRCDLVRADGYFYLVPSGERLGRRTLSPGEMMLGQGLCLLYLDPATLKERGIVERSIVLSRLIGLVGEGRLLQALNFRVTAERVAQEKLRKEADKGLHRLERLGFIDLVDEDRIHLRHPLLRFADPIRGLEPEQRGLERLIVTGRAIDLSEAAAAQEERDDGVEEPQ